MDIDVKLDCCIKKQRLDELALTVEFLKIIAEENRLKILCILLNHDEQCVCQIWQHLALSQNLASHHLKILKDFGVLMARKEGLNVYYSVKHQFIQKHKVLLDKLLVKGEQK
jgi:DNA-binding transcriptional ArsR family regulator